MRNIASYLLIDPCQRVVREARLGSTRHGTRLTGTPCSTPVAKNQRAAKKGTNKKHGDRRRQLQHGDKRCQGTGNDTRVMRLKKIKGIFLNITPEDVWELQKILDGKKGGLKNVQEPDGGER